MMVPSHFQSRSFPVIGCKIAGIPIMIKAARPIDLPEISLGLLSVKDSSIEKRVELKTESSADMLKQLDQAAKQLVTKQK